MVFISQTKTAVPVRDSAGAELELASRLIDGTNALMIEELRSGPVQELIHRYLDTVGDGSGTKNAAVNHAAAAEEYMLVPTGERFRVTKLRVFIRDSAAFPWDGYGGIATGTVTNGVDVKVKDGSGDLLDILHGIPVTCNAMWLHHGKLESLSPFTTGYLMVVTLDFAASGTVIELNAVYGEYLAVVLHDDFSGLDEHYFIAEGFIE